MQRMEEPAGWDGAERRRVEAVVQTLANLRGGGESMVELAHDARNMVTALGLYCDLLEEPGVLAAPFSHYGNELRLVAAASRRLVEKLVTLDARQAPGADSLRIAAREPGKLPFIGKASGIRKWSQRWEPLPDTPIDNLALELAAKRNLLAALAGPAISLTMETKGGDQPVKLTGEDLTRVLVNLVKNAAEAIPGGGRIQIALRERPAEPIGEDAGAASWLALTIEDNGPGIPAEALEKIFDSGYTTTSKSGTANGGWTAAHRGLGLSITRSIVEAADGRIQAANRAQGGACFEIELPVLAR
jgi:signal transduction histidine kinase